MLKKQSVSVDVSKMRDSNIELFRIISMFLIIAHHYVVNSGLLGDGPISSNPTAPTSLFLLIWGAFGKIGINCFVLITGYFMCKANVSAKKFFKLIFEILFYHIVINSIFLISGYTSFSLRSLLDFVVPFRAVDCNFIGTYMLFFLCMPFLNILINNLNEKQHVRLILLSTFIYVFFRTMPLFRVTMNYISWYIVLYFTASYIRLYPKQIFTKTKFWGISTGVCIVFCGLSVVLSAWLSTKINRDVSYFFVMDANTLLAYLTGICSFMFFKNIKIKPSKLINTISSTTFGVLLIHANSDTMRIWLWKDTLKNVEMYSSDWVYLHAILSVTIIFIVCSIIELMRIRFIEKPFFVFFNKHYDKIAGKCLALENKLCEKFKIKD